MRLQRFSFITIWVYKNCHTYKYVNCTKYRVDVSEFYTSEGHAKRLFTTAFALYNSVGQWYHLGFLLLEHQLLQRDFELTCQLCPPKMDNLKKNLFTYVHFVPTVSTKSFNSKVLFKNEISKRIIFKLNLWHENVVCGNYVNYVWQVCLKYFMYTRN